MSHCEQKSAQDAQNPEVYACHHRRRRGRRLFKFLAFLGILWVTATLSYRHGHKVVGFFQMKKLAREMDLTWYQKERLMDVFFDAQQKSFAQRAELHQIKREMYNLLDKENLTQQELNSFIHVSLGKVEKMLQAHTANLLKARNTLSPYQRKVLVVRLQQMEKKRNRWRRHYARYSEAQTQEDHCEPKKSATSQPAPSLQRGSEQAPVFSNPTPQPTNSPSLLVPAAGTIYTPAH